MTGNDQNGGRGEAPGPFRQIEVHGRPWDAMEKDHGPFERRNTPDRRGHARRESSPDEDTQVSSKVESRRRGRRKSDVLSTEAQATLTGRSRALVRRFREPIIGLTLAGVAAPLINAGVNPSGTGEAERASDASLTQGRDLEGNVGEYWAASEADVVRSHTIEGAVTRWGIDAALAEKIYDAATQHDIEPEVAYGLVFTESTFRERAVSHVGARGLAQLMPRTAKWLDPSVDTRDLFDPDVNLELGFRYLRQLIDKYDGNLENALTAYNRGPGTVDKILKRGGNPDNGYAGKVLAG